MTDVEMKDASKPGEEVKVDEKKDEPTDCFYGRLPNTVGGQF